MTNQDTLSPTSEKHDKNRSYGAALLRWAGFIPAAVAGAMIVPIIIDFGNTLAQFGAPKEPAYLRDAVKLWSSTVGELIKSTASGAAFVYFGSITAPCRKKTVALLLAVVWCALNAYLLAVGTFSLWLALNLIFSIAGSVVTYRVFRNSN